MRRTWSASWMLLATLVILAVGCSGPGADAARIGSPRLDIPTGGPEPLDPAGAIPGTAAVQQGAFTYRIPLQLPAGRMGIQPDLALAYGSRDADPGILGVGWSLQGLSSISRCRKTLGTHGIAETVRFDASDSFCLDGEKLHAISGAHGQPGAEYRTEHADFSRIVSSGLLPDGGPEYFTVWTRDGRILDYGRTADSRGTAVLGALPINHPPEDVDLGSVQHIDGPRANWQAPVTLGWHLSSVRDRRGNALQITYLEGGPDSALRIPDEIRYTGHHQPGGTVAGATRTVRFVYESQPGWLATYVGGVSTALDKRLRAIEVHAPAPQFPAKVWSYELGYGPSQATSRSLLREVKLCDPAGDCLPATRFTWDEQRVEYEVVTTPPMALHPDSEQWTRLMLVDLDGDGDDDLLYAGYESNYNLEWWQRPARLFARLSNGLGAATPFGPDIDLSAILPHHYNAMDLHRSRAVSLRRDGSLDLVLARGDDQISDIESGSYRAYDWQNGGLAELGQIAEVTYLELDLADITGDGLADLFAERYDCDTPAACVWLHALHDGQSNPVPAMAQGFTEVTDPSGQAAQSSFAAFAIDLYNDGQAELFSRGPGYGARIIGRTRHGDFGYQKVDWYFGDEALSFADVNGDGLPDLVRGVGFLNAGVAQIRLNTGVSFQHPEAEYDAVNPTLPPTTFWHPDVANAFRWADFDGDGRSDLLFLDLWPPPDADSNWPDLFAVVSSDAAPGMFLTRGGWFEQVSLPASGYRLRHQGPYTAYGYSSTEVGDLDGDGLPEIVQLVTDGWYDFHYHNHRQPITNPGVAGGAWAPASSPPAIQVVRPKRRGLPDKITQVVDGLGRVDRVSYAPITDGAAYSGCAGVQHPQRCVRRGVEVVTRHRVYPAESAAEPTADIAYTYADARADVQGRGFLGFGTVVRQDQATGAVIEERYEHRLGLKTCPGHVYPFAGLPVETRTTTPRDDSGARMEETETSYQYCVRFLDWAPVSDGDYADPDDFFDHGPSEGRTFVPERPGCVLTTHDVGEQASWFDRSCGELRERSYTVELIAAEEVVRWTENGNTVSPVVRVSQQMQHDRWGNVEHRTTTTRAEDGASVEVAEQRVVDITWENHEAEWLIGLPYSVRERSTIGGETRTRQTIRHFSPVDGLLEDRVDQPQGGVDERLMTAYERWPDGQVKLIREMAPGYAWRETSIAYDADGVHPQHTVNAEGHETWWAFHPAHGQLMATVDPNGVQTSWAYDALGRLKKTISADGYVEERRYQPAPVSGSELAVRDSANTGEDRLEAVDGLGRSVYRSWTHFDGSEVFVAYRHDDAASTACHTLPATVGQGSPETCLTTDALGRKRLLLAADGTVREWQYPSLLEAIAIDEVGDEESVVLDAAGRVTERRSLLVENGNASQIVTGYAYGPFGDLMRIVDPEGATTMIVTDDLGRRIRIEDPSAGTMELAYTPFGELRREASGARASEYQHDRLGRVTQVSMSDPSGFGDHRESIFAYDSCPNGIGELCASASIDLSANASQITVEHGYDLLARPNQRRWVIATPWASGTFQVDWDYDAFGRPKTTQYPDVPGIAPRFTVSQSYRNGFLEKVWDPSTGEAYWTAEAYEEDGQLRDALLGNRLRTTRIHDPASRRLLAQHLSDTSTGVDVETSAYFYHDDGNVQTRHRIIKHPGFSWTADEYTYDSLDRLRTWTSVGDRTAHVEHDYSPSGNLLRAVEYELGGALGAVEESTFDPAHPQRVQAFTDRQGVQHSGYQHDALGRMTQGFLGKSTLEIDYTTHDLPRRISDGAVYTYFEYDAHGRRTVKMRDAAAVSSTVYIDELYELRSGGEHVFHVLAGDQRIAQVTYAGPQLARSVQYLHDDPLGTVAAVSDEAGDVIQRFDYLPFGARMDAAGVPLDDNPSATGIRHGFTGHEHDDDLGLINMKGRLYAPALRRFLSPDPLSEPGLRAPLSCLHDACDTAGADPPDRIARSYAGGELRAEGALAGLPAEGRNGRPSFQGDISTRSQTQAGRLHAGASGGAAVPRSSAASAALRSAAMEGLELPSGQAHHRYSYVANNPVRLRDPSGFWIETAFDIAAVVADVASLYYSARSGDVVATVVDTGALIADVAAAVAPIAPAVVGASVRAARVGKAAAPALVKAGGKIADGAKAAVGAVKNAGKGAGQGAGHAIQNAASGAGKGAAGGKRGGMPFTKAGKRTVKEENAAAHGGQTTCVNCGQPTVPGQQSRRGVSPPKNETHVDHVIPRVKSGDGSPGNGQVLCRGCNLEKGAD